MFREKRDYGIIFAVVIVSLILVAAFLMLGGEGSRKEISIEETTFAKKQLSPGDNTTLRIRLKNESSDSRAKDVVVWLEPSAMDSISVDEELIEVGSVGSKAVRIVSFIVSIEEGTLEGTYEILVKTSADSPFSGDEEQVFLDVGGGSS